MKLKTMLFILLIGMISLTTFATTSNSERKQNNTFIQGETLLNSVQNVELQLPIFDATSLKSINFSEGVALVTFEKSPINGVAEIDDVGWQTQDKVNHTTIYKEKLCATSNYIKILNRNGRSNC